MKKQSPTAVIPEGMEQFVKERPDYVNRIYGRGGRKVLYLKLAESIKAMSNGQCIAYTIPQFEELYGSYKNSKLSSIKATLKRHGIKIPRIVFDNGIIYIWENKIG